VVVHHANDVLPSNDSSQVGHLLHSGAYRRQQERLPISYLRHYGCCSDCHGFDNDLRIFSLHSNPDELEGHTRRLMQSSEQHYRIQLRTLCGLDLLGLVLCVDVSVLDCVYSSLN
jgi:hypothetical protein